MVLISMRKLSVITVISTLKISVLKTVSRLNGEYHVSSSKNVKIIEPDIGMVNLLMKLIQLGYYLMLCGLISSLLT